MWPVLVDWPVEINSVPDDDEKVSHMLRHLRWLKFPFNELTEAGRGVLFEKRDKNEVEPHVSSVGNTRGLFKFRCWIVVEQLLFQIFSSDKFIEWFRTAGIKTCGDVQIFFSFYGKISPNSELTSNSIQRIRKPIKVLFDSHHWVEMPSKNQKLSITVISTPIKT